ncbi:MAG: tetratricopeptide repeat protein [Acetobacter sp.]|nr:tetratricopeptide repeat protein [Acetobacter sp.]
MKNKSRKRFLLVTLCAVIFSVSHKTHEAAADALATTYNEMTTKFRDENPTAQNLLKKGNFLAKLGHHDEALADYNKVINTFGSDPFYSKIVASAREGVAKVLYNKGVTLAQQGHIEQAISAYDDVVIRFRDDPALRKWVSRSLVNRKACLSQLLRQQSHIPLHQNWPQYQPWPQ